MSNNRISLHSNSDSDESLIVRAEVYYGSNFSPFIIDHLAHEVISITNYFDLERFSRGYTDEGTSSRKYSFDTLFFDDEVKRDHAAISMPLLLMVHELRLFLL